MTLILMTVLAAGLWTLLSRIGVHMASGGEDAVSPAPLLLAGLVGGALGMIAGTEDPVVSALTVTLCAGLVTGAVVDRQTGWAPDLVILPIVVLALVMGTMTGGWDMDPLHAAICAFLAYWAIQGAWLFIAWKFPDISFPPPGDLIALAIPLLFFGGDLRFVATMMAMAVLLLLARHFPQVYRLFSRSELIMRMTEEGEMDYPEWGHGITFLALAFPVTALSLIISRMV